jgi:histidinol-phosphate aminotransferase
MNRIRQPFNVNSLAQAAAIAALNDKEFLAARARPTTPPATSSSPSLR